MLQWAYNHGFKVIATIVVTIVIIWALPGGICRLSGSAVGPAAITQVKIQKDQMIIQGSINSKLAASVHDLLKTPHDKINLVMVSSNGGEKEPAFRILNDLATLGPHKVVVPSRFVCQSACIVLALDKDASFEPADDATLLFHRAYLRVGPDTCIFCRLVHWETNGVVDFFDPSSHREMYVWAEYIVPGLGAALSRCDPDPFDTFDGVDVTGAQFKAFRSGQLNAIVCSPTPKT